MQWSPEELALKSLNDWWIDAGFPPDQPISLKKQRVAPPPNFPPPAKSKKQEKAPSAPRRLRTDQVLAAQKLAATAQSPEELAKAITGFTGCDLRATARSTVVYDGAIDADVMIICGAPDRDEDKTGKPATGRAGQLLDKMFGAINLSRKNSLYIASLMPWHMLGDRTPDELEWSICRPFIQRQIELVAPKLIITIGKTPSQMLLEKSENIARLRGQFFKYKQESLSEDIPCIPLLAPNYLLVRSAEKAKTWKDLQTIEKLAHELGVKMRF